jgi:hypothetical protein
MTTHDRSDVAVHAVPLADLTLVIATTLQIPNTPTGTRVIVEFSEVVFAGERLRGRRKGDAAADWLSVGPDGTALLDLRWVVETDDGALIYVHGVGRTVAAEFPTGGATFFQLGFETGDARYAWLNRVCAVTKGRLQSDGKTMRVAVYELR